MLTTFVGRKWRHSRGASHLHTFTTSKVSGPWFEASLAPRTDWVWDDDLSRNSGCCQPSLGSRYSGDLARCHLLLLLLPPVQPVNLFHPRQPWPPLSLSLSPERGNQNTFFYWLLCSALLAVQQIILGCVGCEHPGSCLGVVWGGNTEGEVRARVIRDI